MVSPGTPVARFTGNTDMYINAEVSERFIGRFEVGDPVQVMFPNLNESFESKISAIGNTLNANNRTFSVEIRLAPGMENIKANMIATVRLQDYYNPEAISIPANLIMKDRIGPYVWRLVEEEGLPRAHKVYIKTGDLSDQMIEIIEGLELGNRIVDKGYRDMNEGMVVRIAAN
jgi:RND family efflux transporter MFP subunit